MLLGLKFFFIAVFTATMIFISVSVLFIYSPVIVPIIMAPGHRADLAEMLGVSIWTVNGLFALSVLVTAAIHWGIWLVFRMITTRSMGGITYLIFAYIDRYGIEDARHQFEAGIEEGRQLYGIVKLNDSVLTQK